MLPPEIDHAAILVALCKKSYSNFVHEFWECIPGVGKLIWNWHLDVFCTELQIVAERVFKSELLEYDLVLNVPFGTSKSSLVSILYPAWCWTRMPNMRFITATHTDKLVRDLSEKFRSVVRSEKYQWLFPGLGSTFVKESSDYLINAAGGDRQTCTVGGKTPIGFHGHQIIIDDPIDPQGVRSEAELDNAAKFMTEIIPSRKIDKMVTPTILVMQRLHDRDPTSVMLEVSKREGAIPIRHICLPGELTEDTTPEFRSFYVDGLLDPCRLPRSVLKAYEVTLGRYAYAGQILQKPIPLGGGMFCRDWFDQMVKSAPYYAMRSRYWDRAATQGGGAATAGVLMAMTPDKRIYVEDVIRGQWEPNKRNDIIVATAHKDRARYGPRHDPLIVVEAERGSTGKEAFQSLARRLIGFRIREDVPRGSKDVRAEPWADQLAAKNVWIVDDGKWDVSSYIDEHIHFMPEIGNRRVGRQWKDRVDASAGCLRALIEGVSPVGQFKVFAASHSWDNLRTIRIVVCSSDELPSVEILEPSLLTYFTDPDFSDNGSVESGISLGDPVGGAICDVMSEMRENGKEKEILLGKGDVTCGVGEGNAASIEAVMDETPTPPLIHGLSKVLDELTLQFADVDPSDHQDTWDDPLPEFGVPVQQVRMTPEAGKKLWTFLRRKRESNVHVWVFVDDGDRRALSVALAICDTLCLSRTIIYQPTKPDLILKGLPPPNPGVFDIVKSSRRMVV